MDEATLNAYERDAAGFAKEWNEQPSPFDSAFDKQSVVDALSPHAVFLFDREDISASSGKRVHRLVVRKMSTDDWPSYIFRSV
jgi:hypothetical protein